MIPHLAKVRVLLLGDFMLDSYTSGKVSRISPEAPVPVLLAETQYSLPGGAGNVALNLASLGAEVFVAGRYGSDKASKELVAHFAKAGLSLNAFIEDPAYRLPVKTRIISQGQQLLRIDDEVVSILSEKIEMLLFSKIESIFDQIDIVALSDYGKGGLPPRVIQKIIKLAKDRKIPIIVDPKGIDFERYQGATLIKPNKQEAYLAAGADSHQSLESVAQILLKKTQAEMIMITLSQDGIALFTQENSYFASAEAKEVRDVTGAGDTVLALVTVALANNLSKETILSLANLAAGIAVEKVGCVRVSLSDLAHRVLTHKQSSKLISPNAIQLLRQALIERNYLLLNFSEPDQIDLEIIPHIRDVCLSWKRGPVLAIVAESLKKGIWMQLLASFPEITFVLSEGNETDALLKEVPPSLQCVVSKNGIEEFSLLSI